MGAPKSGKESFMRSASNEDNFISRDTMGTLSTIIQCSEPVRVLLHKQMPHPLKFSNKQQNLAVGGIMLVDITKPIEDIERDIDTSLLGIQLEDLKIWIFGNIADPNMVRKAGEHTLKEKYNKDNLKYIRVIDAQNSQATTQVLQQVVTECMN